MVNRNKGGAIQVSAFLRRKGYTISAHTNRVAEPEGVYVTSNVNETVHVEFRFTFLAQRYHRLAAEMTTAINHWGRYTAEVHFDRHNCLLYIVAKRKTG